jgi:hypothetical protein
MAPEAKAAKATNNKRSLKERATEILDKAGETLQQVDQAYIFSRAKKECREFPHFDFVDIESGPLLGTGGFSGVHEVSSITLPEAAPTTTTNEEEASASAAAATTTTTEEEEDSALVAKDAGIGGDEAHYDVSTAKAFMSKHCVRYGSARYAIKKLKPELNELERARGALDLAIEIKFLSVIWHPNIGR